MSTELATVEATGLVSHRAATNAAGLCRDLVVKTAMKIQGRRYVQVEGWQAIANAFGCVASARNVERVEGGFRATGQVIRISDGTVLAEAEGFVGDDETTWTKRPVFARRAMAQTRAMSRACRSAFAFVVTLMDAGLETTPAEEMTHVADSEPVVVRPKFDTAPATETVVPLKPKFTPEIKRTRAEAGRLAIANAATIEACESLRSKLDTYHDAGEITDDEFAELTKLLMGRVEILVAEPQEAAT